MESEHARPARASFPGMVHGILTSLWNKLVYYCCTHGLALEESVLG